MHHNFRTTYASLTDDCSTPRTSHTHSNTPLGCTPDHQRPQWHHQAPLPMVKHAMHLCQSCTPICLHVAHPTPTTLRHQHFILRYVSRPWHQLYYPPQHLQGCTPSHHMMPCLGMKESRQADACSSPTYKFPLPSGPGPTCKPTTMLPLLTMPYSCQPPVPHQTRQQFMP